MPDKILTIEEIHAVDRTLEQEHIHAPTNEMGTWISGGVCTMLLIDSCGTAKSVDRFMKRDCIDPHFKFVMLGRTKGAQEDGHKFRNPLR